MKHFTRFIMLCALLLGTITMQAQDILEVDPGVGTLNTAIATHGGDKIYQLKAGAYYSLDAIVENVDYKLQIIGEVPAEGAVPATLQTGSLGGEPLVTMFDAKGDVTIKNVYIINADVGGVIAPYFIRIEKESARIVVDNCILYPAGVWAPFRVAKKNVTIKYTNNLALNHGHQSSPNDGHFFRWYDVPLGETMDTLYVENSTFVAMGMNMVDAGFTGHHDNYIKWNHNTFVMQKSQLDWGAEEDTWIFSNNLMFDFQTQPWPSDWGLPGNDASAPKPGLVMADTLVDEVLPSTRQQFVQYNLHYRNPKFYTLLDKLSAIRVEDGDTPLIYLPLVWDDTYGLSNPDIKLRSRETILFSDDNTDFPNFKFGNDFNNIDPQFVDSQIYVNSDKFVEWTEPATLIHVIGKDPADYPSPTEWPQWHWYPGDVKPWLDEVWPVFNGKYTNAEMLTSSIESLPLGDLNWFPAEKQIWMDNKTRIDAHIHAGNTDRIPMDGLGIDDKSNLSNVSVYPNPVANMVNIVGKGNITQVEIYNVSGSLVFSKRNLNSNKTQLDLSSLKSGVYMIKVMSGDVISTSKIVKE